MAIAVCWSVTQQVRTHGGAVLHLQGYDYGKPDRTLCGRSFSTGELYDYDVRNCDPSALGDILCKRCAATLRRLGA